MYKLYTITHSVQHPLDLFPNFFKGVNITQQEYLSWRTYTTFAPFKFLSNTISKDPVLDQWEAVDCWEFDTKDNALNFYHILSSPDITINHSRPWDWNKGSEVMTQLGTHLKYYIVGPDGDEEVLYDNKDLLG